MAVRSNEENSKLLNEQLFAKQQKLEELARTNEAVSNRTSNYTIMLF